MDGKRNGQTGKKGYKKEGEPGLKLKISSSSWFILPLSSILFVSLLYQSLNRPWKPDQDQGYNKCGHTLYEYQIGDKKEKPLLVLEDNSHTQILSK